MQEQILVPHSQMPRSRGTRSKRHVVSRARGSLVSESRAAGRGGAKGNKLCAPAPSLAPASLWVAEQIVRTWRLDCACRLAWGGAPRPSSPVPLSSRSTSTVPSISSSTAVLRSAQAHPWACGLGLHLFLCPSVVVAWAGAPGPEFWAFFACLNGPTCHYDMGKKFWNNIWYWFSIFPSHKIKFL